MRFNYIKLKANFLILSWALYDLSNQFFALNVVSLYFPRWLTIEKEAPEIMYSVSFGVSMFLVAICAPIVGTISDITKRRKGFLIYFTFLSIIFTLALGVSPNLFLGLVFFAVANFGCQEAVVFYNALMVKVAPPEKLGVVSGIGKMFGYSGAILALYISKPVILRMGYQAMFFLTGILFLIFSLPCMIFIKEKPYGDTLRLTYFFKKEQLEIIFKRLKSTALDSYRFEELKNFFKAAFFGLCVVNAVILFMSVYVGKVFGLTEVEIINLLAFSTIFAIVGSAVSGFISDIVGYTRTLIGVFVIWGVSLFGAGILSPPFHWLIGALVGISLGSTWVVSRALVINLVPKDKIGEVFGLFNLVGYFAAIIGPLFWGIAITYLSFLEETGYRVVCLSSIVFIAMGIIFLVRINKKIKK